MVMYQQRNIVEITPTNDFESNIFSLLLKNELDNESKKKYGKYFIDHVSEDFIEEIPYDRITKYIYTKQLYDTQVLDSVISELIGYIKRDINADAEKKIFSEKCLKKIMRHIHLALVQYEFISEKQDAINNLNYELQIAQNSLTSLSNDLENKVIEVEKNINSQQISILGVFAGVITAFIGGFGITVNIFSNLVNKVPLAKIITISSILFIGISCTIYLLLSISARVTNNTDFHKNSKKNFFMVIRVLALICLGAVLVFELQYSKANPILADQGIWFEQVSKWVEIVITILMIGIVLVPKWLFKFHGWLGRKIKD